LAKMVKSMFTKNNIIIIDIEILTININLLF